LACVNIKIDTLLKISLSEIRYLAKKEGSSPRELRREMQAVIDEAWENPAAAASWNRYFPDGKKPSVEEFIWRLGGEVKRLIKN
jgi:hypothetical protein